MANRLIGAFQCILSYHRKINSIRCRCFFQHGCHLCGGSSRIHRPVHDNRKRRKPQHAAFRLELGTLGLAVVGLEVGAIFMYKVGWEVSVGNIVQAIFVAIALLIVGVLIYKEALTVSKVAGIMACLVGIYLRNK